MVNRVLQSSLQKCNNVMQRKVNTMRTDIDITVSKWQYLAYAPYANF